MVVVCTLACTISGHGASDPLIRAGSCGNSRDGVCISVGKNSDKKEFVLSTDPSASVIAEGTIGYQFGGSRPAAFVYWKTGESSSGSSGPLVRLSVIDLNGAGIQASVAPPAADISNHFEGYSLNDTYFGIVDGPDGLRYPFLAPGARYLRMPHWEFLCRFDRAAIMQPDPSCGIGFRRYPATFEEARTRSGYRHNGGWLEDVDGDGWLDINLPFLRYILVISGRTGKRLALLHPDFTRQSEPNVVDDFDSGRIYASFSPFLGYNGNRDVLISSADTVGNFGNFYCNVSRYYAVLETKKIDDPASRRLKWSNYISFTKNFFENSQSKSDIPNKILREGDMIDKCIHRVSPTFFKYGPYTLTVYNEFIEEPKLPSETCLQEQWREWRDGFPQEEAKAWDDCAKAAFLPETGRWTARAIEIDRGRLVTSWPDTYVWGGVKDLVPGCHIAFVVETMRPSLRFDRSGYHPVEFRVASLGRDFTWTNCGTLPVSVEPALVRSTPDGIMPYEGNVGASNGGIVEIRTRRRVDGLVDIQLSDGAWIGYSAEQRRLVVGPRAAGDK